MVSPAGAVHGVEGLHVIDTSAMPTLPAADTAPTIMALAEHCARHARRALREHRSEGRENRRHEVGASQRAGVFFVRFSGNYLVRGMDSENS
ncbi:GMC oxidoreductase [Halosaccharopolyspora lacisalsi]|uniref:GMC oxidoreductase n=1 Tax=Halosaccharopolyspora lacisalsi TaxID=1000566 RepID=UPI0015F90C88|nr:GMC oxidoreductase [Halosaccharopolyspora lacisalsi]